MSVEAEGAMNVQNRFNKHETDRWRGRTRGGNAGGKKRQQKVIRARRAASEGRNGGESPR